MPVATASDTLPEGWTEVSPGTATSPTPSLPSGWSVVAPPVPTPRSRAVPVPKPAPSGPLESLANFARPATEFLGGAYEAGKNLVMAPLYIGAGALSEAGLAVSALAGDPSSQSKWAGRLKGLQDLASEDPDRLEQD